jgi:HD superfamily phosphohydrolase
MPDIDSVAPDPVVNRLDDDELWNSVIEGYLKDTPTRDPALTTEVGVIRSAMAAFSQAPLTRYVIVGFLGVGGAGIVFKTWDTALRTHRALKIARPIEGKEDLVAGLLSEEISRLQEVSHPNVIAIFDAGSLPSPIALPFYTMTFLRGAQPAHKYFAVRRPVADLLEFTRGMLAGVAHLHGASLVHLDLKPNNVFVGEDGYAVVADLGGARQLKGGADDQLTITCTTGYAHPVLAGLTSVSASGGDDNRRRGPLRRHQLRVAFDLYAVGRTLFEIIRLFETASPRHLTTYTRKYLQLEAARLLDGETALSERPLGLTDTSLKVLKYPDIAAAVFDLDKLLGKANLLEAIPELSPTNDRVIQVVRGQKTSITPRLTRLIDEPLLRRLASVSQLGLVRLIYPGATHTRLEHSLGAYSNACQYIVALYNDPINPLFRQIVRAEDLTATLLAALLHDLGQYQHAHDLDDVEPKIFKHENLTAALLKGEHVALKPLTDSLILRLAKDWGIKASRILDILEAQPDKLATDLRDRLLHTIISGPIDVDKLDYLIRDSNQCQTVFGRGIDRSRLLATLTVAYERRGTNEDQYFALGIHEKGRAAAESLAFIRFQMYQAVYWHHAVRAAKAMIQRAAYEWIAPEAPNARLHDQFKNELYDFVLQRSTSSASRAQGGLFETPSEPLRHVGNAVQPQWSVLGYSDLLALEWLYGKTSDVGKRLLEGLTTRQLYKRIFVVAASRDATLWARIQDDISGHERLRERSEDLRKALKRRLDAMLIRPRGAPFVVTGVGEADDAVARAADVLGLEGSLLLDVPKRRGQDILRFYPEDLYRGQRDEFEDQPVTVVSELWKVLAERLHETAGSFRVFVHPDIDVLRTARGASSSTPLLGPTVLEDEVKSLFGA